MTTKLTTASLLLLFTGARGFAQTFDGASTVDGSNIFDGASTVDGSSCFDVPDFARQATSMPRLEHFDSCAGVQAAGMCSEDEALLLCCATCRRGDVAEPETAEFRGASIPMSNCVVEIFERYSADVLRGPDAHWTEKIYFHYKCGCRDLPRDATCSTRDGEWYKCPSDGKCTSDMIWNNKCTSDGKFMYQDINDRRLVFGVMCQESPDWRRESNNVELCQVYENMIDTPQIYTWMYGATWSSDHKWHVKRLWAALDAVQRTDGNYIQNKPLVLPWNGWLGDGAKAPWLNGLWTYSNLHGLWSLNYVQGFGPSSPGYKAFERTCSSTPEVYAYGPWVIPGWARHDKIWGINNDGCQWVKNMNFATAETCKSACVALNSPVAQGCNAINMGIGTCTLRKCVDLQGNAHVPEPTWSYWGYYGLQLS